MWTFHRKLYDFQLSSRISLTKVVIIQVEVDFLIWFPARNGYFKAAKLKFTTWKLKISRGETRKATLPMCTFWLHAAKIKFQFDQNESYQDFRDFFQTKVFTWIINYCFQDKVGIFWILHSSIMKFVVLSTRSSRRPSLSAVIGFNCFCSCKKLCLR